APLSSRKTSGTRFFGALTCALRAANAFVGEKRPELARTRAATTTARLRADREAIRDHVRERPRNHVNPKATSIYAFTTTDLFRCLGSFASRRAARSSRASHTMVRRAPR